MSIFRDIQDKTSAAVFHHSDVTLDRHELNELNSVLTNLAHLTSSFTDHTDEIENEADDLADSIRKAEKALSDASKLMTANKLPERFTKAFTSALSAVAKHINDAHENKIEIDRIRTEMQNDLYVIDTDGYISH